MTFKNNWINTWCEIKPVNPQHPNPEHESRGPDYGGGGEKFRGGARLSKSSRASKSTRAPRARRRDAIRDARAMARDARDARAGGVMDV